MQIDTTEMAPWADINRILSNCRTLSVKVGNRTHQGSAVLSDDGSGNVTLAFEGKKGK